MEFRPTRAFDLNARINQLFNSILSRHDRLTSMAHAIPGAQHGRVWPAIRRERKWARDGRRLIVGRRRFHRGQIANPLRDQICGLTIHHR